jgi:hypothetical protein
VLGHLCVADDLKWQAMSGSSLTPLGRASDPIAVDEERGGQPLEKRSQVNGRSGLCRAALVIANAHEHAHFSFLDA